MKANECQWFACVYAMKPNCAIEGYKDGETRISRSKENCKHYEVMCIRAHCSYCRREGEKSVCPNCLDSEDE